MTYDAPVDFQADARQMPVANTSAAAILFNAFGKIAEPGETHETIRAYNSEMRQQAIKEAYRALKHGGFLIWERGSQDDLSHARQLGFKIKRSSTEYKLPGYSYLKVSRVYSFIAQK